MDKVFMFAKVAGAFFLFYCITVFMPMAFTYFSSGDVRP